VIAKFHIPHCGYLSLTELPKMNSDRYSPDDLTSDHDEDVAAEQQQPKSAPEKPNPAKPNRAKKKDTDKVTGATRLKKSPPKKTSARVRRTDSDKMADKATEKVTGKAGGKAKANAATTTKIGSVKGGPVRAEEKRPARRTATNRVGKTALSKDAVMRAMAKQELVANNIAERQAFKLEQDQANSAALRKELKAKQSKTPAEIGGQGVIWSLLALGLAACGGGGTKFISGPTVNVPKLHDNKVSSAELAASEAARAKAEAAKCCPQRRAGDMKSTAEMMPTFCRRVAGEDCAPADQPVALNHRTVDGRRRPARQDGAVTEIDISVDGRDIQQPALAVDIDIGRAGDACRCSVGKTDLPQRPAACRDKNRVGGQEFHAPGMRQLWADPLQ
jgi:hypothetical protein